MENVKKYIYITIADNVLKGENPWKVLFDVVVICFQVKC